MFAERVERFAGDKAMPITCLHWMKESETPNVFLKKFGIPSLMEGEMPAIGTERAKKFSETLPKGAGDYEQIWFVDETNVMKRCMFQIYHLQINDPQIREKKKAKNLERPQMTFFGSHSRAYLPMEEKEMAAEKMGLINHKHLGTGTEPSTSVNYLIPHEAIAHWKPKEIITENGRKIGAVFVSHEVMEELSNRSQALQDFNNYSETLKYMGKTGLDESGKKSWDEQYLRKARLDKRNPSADGRDLIKEYILNNRNSHSLITATGKIAEKLDRELKKKFIAQDNIKRRYGRKISDAAEEIYGNSVKTPPEIYRDGVKIQTMMSCELEPARRIAEECENLAIALSVQTKRTHVIKLARILEEMKKNGEIRENGNQMRK